MSEEKPKPKAYKFKEPLYLDVLRPGELVSIGPAGQPEKQLVPAVVEIDGPQGLHDFVVAAQHGAFRVVPALPVQLFLIIWREMGNIVADESPAGPTGILDPGDVGKN